MSDISVLSALEPLFGAGLAINLAYLNLNQFRYRDAMAKHAAEMLGNAPDTVRSTEWFQQIQSLADQTEKKNTSLKLPTDAVWSYLYRTLFHWRLDKSISILFTALSAAYLYLGVSHDIGINPMSDWASKAEIKNELIYAAIGLCWPMAMVLIAKFCTWRCNKFVSYQLENIAKTEIREGTADVAAASDGLDAAVKEVRDD